MFVDVVIDGVRRGGHSDPPVDGVVVLNGKFDGVSCVSAVAPLSQRDAGLFQGRGKLAGIVASLDLPVDPRILST
jgi:hypothetical protein